jgi:enamine deaminase RidA (YjgF/YER057c/UK114 family)
VTAPSSPASKGGAKQPPHLVIDPPQLAKPVGYAHGVLAAKGRTLFLGGQVGWDAAGAFRTPFDLVQQVDQALSNLVVVLKAAGGAPEHVTALRIFVLSAEAWRANAREIGAVWKTHMGRWFPAMALLEVSRLYEPEALVEIEGTAVIPDAT